ncbi:4-alpha-glucanotransferase [Sphingomonas sp. 22176]|uniref:4-alpha-glucanotransferase n=1 Tax=Sphingomonas sp. 22176 TaxID=3453884 RepID=UPI003F83FEC6
MSDADVMRLAKAAELLIEWEDAAGQARTVSPESLRLILDGLGLACGTPAQCAESMAWLQARRSPLRILDGDTVLAARGRVHLEDGSARDAAAGPLPIGYHRLETDAGMIDLAVAPPQGWRVADLRLDRRPWGTAVQLYSLREGDAFGDFGALGRFVGVAGAAGLDAVAMSPVHALFTADPQRYSPYSPSSREYLNPLYADPALLGFDATEADGPALIDWPVAAPAKLARLRDAYAALPEEAAHAFADYVAAADGRLIDHARFEALHGHFLRTTGAHGWQGWPEPYRNPRSPEVAAFADAYAGEVRFHLFLQWLADASLARAADAARGMALGLIADIAVGLDVGGSHAWSRGDELMLGIGIGAPPDAFQAAGQNWGITSFSPFALREQGYAPFLSLLRSAMRHAGGVRIDHALGLRRLWVVPNGASPLDGAYLTMPEVDLLRLIALESHRAQAIVIGEDLGVVPPGLREALTAHGLYGMRVLPFERDENGFIPPARWPAQAVAMTSTHDLPPIAGWWKGRDIDWRERLAPDEDRSQERIEREEDRARFREAVEAAGIAEDDPVDAAIAYAASAPCELLIVPAEDLFAIDEAPNLPGTIDEHPNWRRRLPADAATLFAAPAVRARIQAVKDRR